MENPPPSTPANRGPTDPAGPTQPPPASPAPDGGFHDPDAGEFSNFFSDVRAAWDRFGTLVVGILLAASLLIFGYRFVQNRTETARQYAWTDLYSATTPDSLQLLGENVNSPSVAAVAYLRAGDLLLTEAATAAPADAEAIYGSAEQQYRAALDAADHPIYRVNAQDGLGVVAESRGDFEAAGQHYRQMRDAAGHAFPYWTAMADRRLALLDQVREPVTFAPEPAAGEAPAGEQTDASILESILPGNAEPQTPTTDLSAGTDATPPADDTAPAPSEPADTADDAPSAESE